MKNRHYAPDNDTAGGNAPAGSTPATGAQPNGAPAGGTAGVPAGDATQPDPKRIAGERYSSGINEERMRFGEDFERLFLPLGIEPVKNEAGNVDRSRTLEALRDRLQGGGTQKPPAAKPGNGAAAPTEADAETERLRQELAQERERATQERERAAAALAESEVTRAFSRLSVVPEAAADVPGWFLQKYKVRHTAEGVRVYEGSKPVFNTAGAPATVEEVAALYIEERPYLKLSSAAPRMPAGGTPAGGVRVVTSAEAAAGRISAADLASGKVVIQD